MFKSIKIKSIKSVGIKTVYDLQIDDDESYLAEGFINHNSTPNVQNLPRRTPSITTLTGRVIEPSNIRGIFTAPPPFKLFSSDLSQAELRIMADYANDIMMLDYIKRKEDIHWTGCLKIFYKDQKLIYDSKNPEMKRLRKLTKLCNFGGVYGGSDHKKVSSVNEKLELGEPKIDLKIAGAHTEWFNSEFPDIQNYIKVQNDHIAKYGWIDNKFGRRRRLPDVFTKDKYLIAEAQRQGINCVDELTQCLTKRGWLSYNQVTLDDEILTKNIDTGFLEWDKIQAINVYDNYQGDMYLFENKENNISALTTPDHRWLVKYSTRFSEDNLLERDQRKNELINNRDMLKEKIIKLKENNLNPLQISKRLNISYIKVRRMLNLTKKSSKDYRDLKPIHEYLTSEELSKLNQVKSIHLSGKYQGSVIKYYDNDLIELIGWILTDGHLSYYNSGQPSRVSLTQSFIANPEKCQIIKDLILRLNLKVSEKKRDRSYIWRFQSSLGRTLHEIIPHKKITMEFLLKLTNEQLNILLKSIQLGDGKRITTVNRNHLDMFQALIILTGQSSNSSLRDNIGRKSYSDKLSHNQKYIEKKQISYHINIHKRKYVHHKNTRKQDTFFKLIKNYQGIIWCPTVKNSNMICRRFANNKYYQFITGQSQIQGTASDIVQLSIIRITKWLEENQMQSKIIYSVHDELDGYAFPDEIKTLKEIVPKMMCEKVFPVDKIKVDLESEFDIYNHRWGD